MLIRRGFQVQKLERVGRNPKLQTWESETEEKVSDLGV